MSRVHRRPITLAAVGVAILLIGCGSDDETETGASSKEPATTATETAGADVASRLEGSWQTAPISRGDVDAALRQDGLARWSERFRPVTPIAAGTTLILDLHNGEWDLYGKPRSGPRAEIDYDAEYVVKGDKVEKTHATGVTTYRWSVDGDTLTLKWLSTTEPPVEGIPDEVFGRALYMTQPFMRQN